MRIIAFVNNNSGPAYHRIIMPLLLMPEVDVFVTNNLLEEHFEKGCDIFMYNRILPDHAGPLIAKLKEKCGFKTIVDVDDFWELEPNHILHQEYIDIEFVRMQIEHIRNADMVFTTHWRLVCEIQAYNLNVYVLPNAIPRQGQFDIEKVPGKLTRLFWQGSVTHGDDIEILKRPIDCLGAISGKIKMVMAGYMDTEPEWYRMVVDYTSKTKHQYLLLPGVHVAEYYKHYEQADICLIPLVNNPFNRLKSNLKVLEAANMELPVICSPVHPYLNLPVIYAKGAGDWVRNIQRLVASKKRQKEAGEELAEYCAEHYNFHKINKERKQVLEHVSKYVKIKSI